MAYHGPVNGGPSGETLALILGAMHAVEARIEESLEPLGLSLAKFGALAEMVEAGEPLALGALADRCACVRSNITQLVDRLEADRLVVRSDDPHDRRSVRATLTPEGRSRHAAALRVIHRAEQDVLSRIPAEHRESFLRTLESLRGVRAAAV